MLKLNLSLLFGKKIKSVRESLKLSQEGFAEFLGIERDSISKIENGKMFPSGKRLEKIALKLNMNYSELFNFENYDTDTILNKALYSEIEEIKDTKAKQYIIQAVRLYKESHKR